eukprot:2631417-Ditylum_brightwellii.AAC.1
MGPPVGTEPNGAGARLDTEWGHRVTQGLGSGTWAGHGTRILVSAQFGREEPESDTGWDHRSA